MAATEIATQAEFLALVEDASSVGPRAAGTIEVVSYPVTPGTTITLGSLVLTAVNGAPGVDQFRGDAGDAGAVATSINTAIAAATNSWTGAGIASSLATTTQLAVLGNRGPDGDVELESSAASEIAVSGLEGGDAWVDHALNTFAARFIHLNCWGEFTNMASIYLAAHFLTQLPNGLGSGAEGTVSGITIGSISKSYAVATPTDPMFGKSTWGQLYLALAERIICAPGGVAGKGGKYPLGVVG